VLPIYPATEGLSQKVLRGIIDQNLDRLLPLLQPADAVPRELHRAAELPTLMQAIVRAAPARDAARRAERGRRRLAFDELFFLQLLHARAGSATRRARGASRSPHRRRSSRRSTARCRSS
jgi:ATP-dependent DNA helicase RecG